MGTITKFKVEVDPFYLTGINKGRTEALNKKNHDVVENLIVKLRLSDEQAEVSITFVKKVRKELEGRK